MVAAVRSRKALLKKNLLEEPGLPGLFFVALITKPSSKTDNKMRSKVVFMLYPKFKGIGHFKLMQKRSKVFNVQLLVGKLELLPCRT